MLKRDWELRRKIARVSPVIPHLSISSNLQIQQPFHKINILRICLINSAHTTLNGCPHTNSISIVYQFFNNSQGSI